jgi:hypothetical protein
MHQTWQRFDQGERADCTGVDDRPRVTLRLADDRPRVTRVLDGLVKSRGSDGKRIHDLINALGDPDHPAHTYAVTEVAAHGARAVPALIAALAPDKPWLGAYRAAEALALIGDERACGALVTALHHPNSNVRWNVIRTLAQLGDLRSLWALRRVARNDRSKTSWGEAVSDTAQVAIERLAAHAALPRLAEPITTGILLVAMLMALSFAGRRMAAVRAELRRDTPTPAWIATLAADDTRLAGTPIDCEVGGLPRSQAQTMAQAAPLPILARVRVPALAIRSTPTGGSSRVGMAHAGDQMTITARCGAWYRIRLPRDDATTAGSTTEGWIAGSVLAAPGDAASPVAASAQPPRMSR